LQLPSIANYDQMLRTATAAGPVPVAIAAAQEEKVLVAAAEAQSRGIIDAILVGDEARIRELAGHVGLDPQAMRTIDVPDPVQSATKTMQIVTSGEAKVAVKGQLPTSLFLRAALDRDAGLRTGRLISHVGIFEIPGFERILFITDGGVILHPITEQKIEIVSNGIAVAKGLGIQQPKVALLASSDQVRSELPTTLEIAGIVAMERRWASEGASVDGPFLLDTAVSPQIAEKHSRDGPVAGLADVLVAPDVESGNIMAKGITYFAGGRMAGLVVGARAPLVVGSRADPPHTRLVCIAAGALLAAGLGGGLQQRV
jgi:phosphate butyryltransferase